MVAMPPRRTLSSRNVPGRPAVQGAAGGSVTYPGSTGPPVTAVPRLNDARSSDVTPAPRQAAWPSPRPGDDRRPGGHAGRLGGVDAVTSPMTVPGRDVSQNCSGRRPMPVMRSSAQASCSTSVSPNESADARLVVHSPRQALDEVAVGVHELCARSAISGSFCTSQSSLGNACVSDGPRPVRRCSSSWPKRSPSSASCAPGARRRPTGSRCAASGSPRRPARRTRAGG